MSGLQPMMKERMQMARQETVPIGYLGARTALVLDTRVNYSGLLQI